MLKISLKDKLQALQAKRQDRGLSLTETLLVLGVIALVAVIAYAGYNAATGSVKAGGDAQALVQLAGNINKTFATAADYNGVTVANLINAGLVPKAFKTRGITNIIHSNGSDITVGFAPAANSTQYAIAYSNVPADQCMEVAQSVASAVQEVYIVNTAAVPALTTKPAVTAAVKTLAAPTFDVVKAIPLCAPTTAARHILVYGS